MTSLDFFAAHDDQVAILTFIFECTDLRIFEAYSACGQPLREFHSAEGVEAAYELGFDQYGHGLSIFLQLWPPSVMHTLDIQRIELDPRSCDGHTFRYRIEGWGLIQLQFGGIHNDSIIKSHYGHNSQQRAKAWNAEAGVDWETLNKLSNKIQYHIQHRLAVAKVPGRPVLRHAFELAKQGYKLKEDAADPDHYVI